jgi:hypothetical protein
MNAIILLLPLLLMTPAIAYAEGQTKNFLTYTNTNYGFTIKYPADWNVDDSNISSMGVLFGKIGQGDVQVWRSLATVANPANESLEHVIKNILVYQQAHGFRLMELNTNTYFLSGHPAIRVVGVQGAPEYNHDVEIMTTTIKSGAHIYTIKYLSPVETYLTYLPIAQKMVDTFQVINSQ